jgi:hypothetical protein
MVTRLYKIDKVNQGKKIETTLIISEFSAFYIYIYLCIYEIIKSEFFNLIWL